jgi:hypothetical protein
MLRPAAIACVLMAHLGCYDPSVRDCAVSCKSAAECAGGQTCSGDGFCVSPEYRGRCGHAAEPDASEENLEDGPVDSAENTAAVVQCQQGCTGGTCDAQGVCVIDCSATGACSATDVICPASLPCRVVCGENACAHHVQCGTSTSCDVQCVGAASCGDVIQCPVGRCDVTCSGAMSCHKNVKCGTSCACDVGCTGSGACGAVSVCPQMTSCLLGRGCTSALNGCDTCS